MKLVIICLIGASKQNWSRLSLDQFKERMQDLYVVIVDTRHYLAFGGSHVSGSWHLDLNGNFPTFGGWVLPVDKDILLIADDDGKAQEAVVWARQVGLDRVVGYLAGGINNWLASGLAASRITQNSAKDLHEMVLGEDDFAPVDVRSKAEFDKNHIKGAIHIEVPDLRTAYHQLDPQQKTVLICSSGLRSSLGWVELRIKYGSWGMNGIGGLIFGVGFAILGYCPGTIAGAVGNGYLDALVGGLAGIWMGTGLFAALYPKLRSGILQKGDYGDLILPKLFKVNDWGVVIPAAVLIGLILYLIESAGL